MGLALKGLTFHRKRAILIFVQPPKISRFMSLYQFSRIALKNFKHRNISLSKNDHCNLELSENIQFEKYNQSVSSMIQKICTNIKVQRSYFRRIARFLCTFPNFFFFFDFMSRLVRRGILFMISKRLNHGICKVHI